MELFNEQVIQHLYGTLIIMLAVTALVGGGFWLLMELGCRLEEQNRARIVEEAFMAEWDGSKTNRLYAWHKAKRRLERQGAKPQVIDEVERRIRRCRQDHRRYRSVKLKNGRCVIISTQN